ncbi:PQQ-dependent sugar dehydrogenase [Stenotrophobium rhamnosiphilum]|uniref:Sorbosone dehydrogenase n=1 Tax=Stenotrophobium rhamnosiphilum TaxID=2029166 RepID=A0A2T5MD52_9GAMM|nr:sorbosone dehydrogenase family protein [Stenotrophobium rhamnosiphilum]PTU30503.1 sorbosone dehydrogenase [Stenotrophobium rhamnosiphilum]
MNAQVPAILLALLLPTIAGATDADSFEKSTGPRPTLPAPTSSMLPTLHIAPAKSWPAGATPKAAPGFAVKAFAKNLDHPRWLYVLPNGDVLVAESDSPPQPEDNKGLKGWFAKFIMKRAGSGHPSANRISLLRDTNNDGFADVQTVFLKDLNSPFGMALIGNDLYVANTDAVLRFPYKAGDTVISAAGKKFADLPGGPLNHHWTKNIIASKDGLHLYATVGSNSNVAENGMDKEFQRAAILEIDVATGKSRVFASGLRNPNGMDWEPKTGALWTVVNERDELGNDLVPDYLTSVKPGAFYGWPYSYYGQHVDTRVTPARPDLVAKAIPPDYALGGHVAALGLTFYQGKLFPQRYNGGAFIGQHGSWNRKPRSGYNVVFVPFNNGTANGKIEEVLTGFVDEDGDALGRPVGVTVDQKGALLVADDVGNTVWRVVPNK